MSVFFNKKLGAGLFGGEGFIMQRISGYGTAFAEFDGHVVEYELQPGQQIVVDTGSSGSHDCHLFHRHSGRSRGKKYALWR